MSRSAAVRRSAGAPGSALPRAAEPVLVIDIGNTSTHFGVARGVRIVRESRILTRSGIRPRAAAVEFARVASGMRLAGCALCSVVPERTAFFARAAAAATGMRPWVVTHRAQFGIRLAYPAPHTLGPDRIVNACAAAHLHGTPAVVLSVGTALTLDAVSPAGEFVGGIIAPGPAAMADFLAGGTSLLPRVAPGRARAAYGRSTREALQVGLCVGYRGLVRGLVLHLRGALRWRSLRACATGGYARWALRGTGLRMAVDPHLTLRGVSIAWALNREEAACP